MRGREARYRRIGEELHIAAPSASEPVDVTVSYRFTSHDGTVGWNADTRLSFLWPSFCGNLFPCRSSPRDGSTFELDVVGEREGEVLIYPRTVALSTPAYVPAIAAGRYVERVLGTTEAGTRVSVWHLPDSTDEATRGTRQLVEAFDYFERTLGPYRFGDHVGSVEAPWPGGGYGGMEHHPYWHVAAGSMGDDLIHLHEAAHGWFGDAVRIACWEDFVLSEGLATYLAARAVEAVSGESEGATVWANYRVQLEDVVRFGDTVALPDETCNGIELLSHPLWSSVPYLKGAFFVRAVEIGMGRSSFDAMLARFYSNHVGEAVRMQDLLDAIAVAGYDASRAERGWLRSVGIPRD
ncbi:MAG: hypothetical protein H6722_11590 [Sandaracinus sp.]|nr:hypothetical protein [Sandaracinus sp.]MCB9613086.1 hypothetical protein [Sandaracinus sp.]MCB9624635.1 hypothetical protein [Sandaracinus sp.]